MSDQTIIFAAKKIITINANCPSATHVAVRDGRILGVGSLSDLEGWGDYVLDEQFADKILTPGFVEGHAHVMDGAAWGHTYVGRFERTSPTGELWAGITSIEGVIDRLKKVEAEMDDPDAPLWGWGFDPIYFDQRMTRSDLDQISTSRPIAILHASAHLINVNSMVMDAAEADTANIEGVLKDEQGIPTGELQEMAAMFLAMNVAGGGLMADQFSPKSIRLFGKGAQLKGVTTVTDLYNPQPDKFIETLLEVTAEEDFPVRIMSAFAGAIDPTPTGVEKVKANIKRNTDKCRFGLVKLMTDGSIQGFTARLKWPGYFNGKPNGIWNTGPDELTKILDLYTQPGMTVHIHTNGDEATEVGIEAMQAVLGIAPRPDHRTTLQHCQMADASQFRRMAKLGMNVNLFSNHIFYWGDEHASQTMGPDRAKRSNAMRTAISAGVPVAMHSDAPITPIAPLFTAWCAVNRLTASGKTLGSAEKITVKEALRAITLGAAYTLKMDGEIGSIEVGKRADFAVLEQDPLAIDPVDLKDIPVWGTVLGGKIFKAPAGNG